MGLIVDVLRVGEMGKGKGVILLIRVCSLTTVVPIWIFWNCAYGTKVPLLAINTPNTNIHHTLFSTWQKRVVLTPAKLAVLDKSDHSVFVFTGPVEQL